MNDTINRGEIYYADIEENQIGSEQIGVRPVVILQNNLGNSYSPTIIIAPITSKITVKAKIPTHVELLPIKKRLPKKSIILLEQIRTIDKSRLSSYIGSLNFEETKKVDRALIVALGIGKTREQIPIDDRSLEKADNMECLTRKQIASYGVVARKFLSNAGNLEIPDKLFCNYILTIMELFSPEDVEERAEKYMNIKEM